MIGSKKVALLPTLLGLLVMLVYLSSWTALPMAALEKGYIKGRARVMVRVYAEETNLTKGALLYSDWLDPDQYVSISTERGRVIYDYRTTPSESWTTEVHAWCRGSREEALAIP